MSTDTATPATTDTTSTEVAIALYQALGAGDVAGAAAHLAPDVVLHVPGTHPLAGDYHGVDGVFAFLAGGRERADEGQTIELLDILTGTSSVGVHIRVRATRGERTLDNSTIHLLRIERGRVVEVHLHNFDGVAVDAFWS